MMHRVITISDGVEARKAYGVMAPQSPVLATMAEPVGTSASPVEWLQINALTPAHLAEWQKLAQRAGEANVFAEPWMVLAGLRHCHEGAGAVLAFVRNGSGALIGIAPMAASRGFGRAPVRMASGWGHPNSFLSTLLIAEGCATAFWLRLLPAIAEGQAKAPILCLHGVPADGPMHAGLIEACRQLALSLSVEGAVTRAMLATTMDPDAYWDESVRAKKRKELRRQWSRLNEQGVLTTDHLAAAQDGGADAAAWIDEFLRLEASGWKGANGSALSSNSDTDGFFRTAMLAAHDAGQMDITALRVDGRAIAMLITLFSGRAGFSFKTAFDEDFARYSPGVLLQRESLSILSQHRLDWIDSCAAQDHPMIDSLWRERRTVLSLALPLPGTINRLTYTAAQAAKRSWHAIKRLRSPAPTHPTPRPEPQPGLAPAGSAQEDLDA